MNLYVWNLVFVKHSSSRKQPFGLCRNLLLAMNVSAADPITHEIPASAQSYSDFYAPQSFDECHAAPWPIGSFNYFQIMGPEVDATHKLQLSCQMTATRI